MKLSLSTVEEAAKANLRTNDGQTIHSGMTDNGRMGRFSKKLLFHRQSVTAATLPQLNYVTQVTTNYVTQVTTCRKERF